MESLLTYEHYYEIAYSPHRIMNPLTEQSVILFSDLAGLTSSSNVLDIGSGKGYVSLAIASLCGAFCTQVDIAPHWTEQAKELFAQQSLSSKTSIIQQDAKEFEIQTDTFDMIVCLGNSPIYGGFAKAVEAFLPGLKPGGSLLMGEATIPENIPEEYYSYLEEMEWMLPSEEELLLTIEEHELELLYAKRSTKDEWDHYMGLQWKAVWDYIRNNPTDELVDELKDWLMDEQEQYLRFQRHFVDWTVFLLRKPQ